MKLYMVWSNMKQRCYNPQNSRYKRYGGRGIKVCDEWRDNFQAFKDYVSELEHFGEEGYSLDRIDNDGNYAPGNVRWANRKTQQRNRQNNHLVEYDGRQMTVAEAAELSGVKYSVLLDRVNRGAPAEEQFLPAVRGKPLGWRKPEGVRKQRTTKAYDDEWELIQRFAELVKYGDKEACRKFLESQES